MKHIHQARKKCKWLGMSLLVAVSPLHADNLVQGGLTYAIDIATQTAAVTGYDDSTEVITIPSEVSGCTVTSIADNAFYNTKTLQRVIIPSSVIRIGRSAFAYGQKLQSVQIPASVTEIGYHAFNGCSQMQTFTVDANNPSYSAEGTVLFNKDRTQLIAANGIKGSYLLPETVSTIADYAFERCDGMLSVTLPSSLTAIGNAAFYDCLSVTSIHIPASVTSIAPDVLSGCAKLKSITVDDGNFQYSTDGQVLYNKDYTRLIGACRSLSGHYVVPATTTTIGDGAFYGCQNLTSVTLPSSLRSIGYYAFAYSALKGIDIPNALDSIGLGAFQYCNHMCYANITGGNMQFGPQIFTDSTRVACTNACSVRLKDSQAEIAKNYSGKIGNYIGGNWYGTDLLSLATSDAQQVAAPVNDSTSVLSQTFALRAEAQLYVAGQKGYYDQLPEAVRQQFERVLASSDNFGAYTAMSSAQIADSLALLKQAYTNLLIAVDKVQYSRPDWQVDPRLYEYNMNIIGKLMFDGEVANNKISMLAAFDPKGNCVGVAMPQYNAHEKTYLTMLTVYGNANTINKAFTFKAWDATAHRVCQLVDADKCLMKANDVLGTLHSPVVFNALRYSDKQEFRLHKGWQWLTFNTLPDDSSVGAVLSTLAGNSVMLKSQTAFAVRGSSATAWRGTLDSINVSEMYELNMADNATWQVAGHRAQPADVVCSVASGWNWIAYVPQYEAAPAYALAALNPAEGDVLKSQNDFAVYDNGHWFGNLDMMKPGEGYMYKRAVDVAQTFNYPTEVPLVSAAQRKRAAATIEDRTSAFPEVDRHAYPNNMTMIARVELDGQSVADAEVAAYIDGECRGTARANGELYFITISGQGAEQPLTLRVAHDGQIYDTNATLAYADNAMLGTLANPYVLTIPSVETAVGAAQAAEGRVNIMPHHVTTHVTISTDGTALRYVAVYNAQGQLCYASHTPSAPVQIDMASMPSGVYVVKAVTADGRCHAARVIK